MCVIEVDVLCMYVCCFVCKRDLGKRKDWRKDEELYSSGVEW